MRKQFVAVAAAVSMVAGLLAGCGSSNNQTEAQKSEETTKAAVETEAEEEEESEDAETTAAVADDGTVYNIGVIQLAEHPALDASYEGFKDALAEAGFVEGENVEFDFNNAQGDISNCETIAQKLVNNNSDLVLAIATPAAQAVAGKTTEIPIIGTAITDFVAAGLVDSDEVPGTNVSGSSDMNPIAEQIELLTELIPDAKKIGIMYCSSEDNSIVQAEIAAQACTDLGLEYEEYTVSDTTMIQSVAESMIGKVDAIYVPTDNLLAEAMSTVTMITNANGMPVIAGEVGMVENGGLATYGIDYYSLGKIAGEKAVEVLNGADVSTLSIAHVAAEDCALSVNSDAAAELGISLDAVMDRAEDVAQ